TPSIPPACGVRDAPPIFEAQVLAAGCVSLSASQARPFLTARKFRSLAGPLSTCHAVARRGKWARARPSTPDGMGRAIMICSHRLGLDAVVGVLLAAVLLGVYLVDRSGSVRTPQDPGGARAVEDPPAPVPVKLAVTPAGFDDMGKLLGTLGEGYRYE